MDSNKRFFDIGVKYVVPITMIAATLIMKKSSGWGKMAVFAFSTPILFFSLLSLEKARRGELFPQDQLPRTDIL